MIVIVLCGGSGTRMKDYSFPKPLNMIYGKPAIYYTLMNLPSAIDTIHFVVAPHLHKFNFTEIVTNTFPTRKCVFHNLDYFTRGALETAYVGTKGIASTSESVVFLDNDVIYNFPDNFFKHHTNPFIGYDIDTTGTESYSFLHTDISGTVLLDYKEKVRISDKYCCGVYGFPNLTYFREIALEVLFSQDTGIKEAYMSSVYTRLLKKSAHISTIKFAGSNHVGSLVELESRITAIPTRQMRICFDLDNTLVTYPQVAGDYSTVRPIMSMINLARNLHEQGHTIIIYTARRMITHKNNIGAVIKDIGSQTFKTLEEFNIPYDELIFGKPIADMYIDDRAINPYRNDIKSMGLITYNESELPTNMLGTNKYNNITVADNIVKKNGPIEYIRGEEFFYKNMPAEIAAYFPKLYYSKHINDVTMELGLEYIKGVPLYTLYKHQLVTDDHIKSICTFMDVIHNIVCDNKPAVEQVISNYTNKLRKRFLKVENYPFDDASYVQKICLDQLDKYYTEISENIVGCIHGDLWFSNIIVGFDNKHYYIDMKGQVDGHLTLGGDKMYDYAKLYQSCLGYDAVLYNDTINTSYMNKVLEVYEQQLRIRKVNIEHLRTVTFSLVLGTFHAIELLETKDRIWKWIKETFLHS